MVQVNPADEETKFGIEPDEVDSLIKKIREECPHIRVKGLMCIAPFFDNPEDCRPVFASVKKIFDRYEDFEYLSMGMSHDFEIAIEEGANSIRVGTAIFGNRDYRREER